jgi:hypothetical protein
MYLRVFEKPFGPVGRLRIRCIALHCIALHFRSHYDLCRSNSAVQCARLYAATTRSLLLMRDGGWKLCGNPLCAM